ncbi:DUF3142 domain-containing protein [Musicola keenii]|uniref:DUF3142 domain-containing protein n=1 Tax=Musicola keenii TaxID=2884250 RepID=UPI0017843813|nr:DUF3142 domain-containing protein [Musicola keenii]
MGKAAQVLLVSGLLLACLWCLPFSADSASAHDTTVNADRYQAFWLWAAVQPQPVLHQANTLYLHQGELARRNGKNVFLRQGLPPSRLAVKHLWLSFRVSELVINEHEWSQLLRLRQRWSAYGNPVEGIQIDFDAKSRHLAHYAAFLQELRKRLPPGCKLSITGLLDWTKNGDIGQLNQLNGVVDELVVQTYQGRRTVATYADYLPSLLALKLPFRIGLVQHGKWNEQWQRRLSASPFYLGEVVFLLNPTPSSHAPLLDRR